MPTFLEKPRVYGIWLGLIGEVRKRELLFRVGDSDVEVTVGELIPSLLILDMQTMMYTLKMDVNVQHSGLEIVGFGKSDEEKSYLLFIKV